MAIEKLGPGIYRVDGAELHLDTPELLRHFGYPDTPANRDMCAGVAAETLRQRYPNVPGVITREGEPDQSF